MKILSNQNIFRIKPLRILLAECGHETRPLGEVEIIINRKKETVIVEVTSDRPGLCLGCFKRAIILCCNCGDSILMGNMAGIIKMENPPLSAIYIPAKEGYVCCENCCDKTEGYWFPVDGVTECFSFDKMGLVPEEEMPVDPRFK